MTSTYLVFGATGQQGQAVVGALLANDHQVKAVTRDPADSAARRIEQLGAGLVAADLDRPDSLKGLFDGVDGVFLALPLSPGRSGAEVERGKALIEALSALDNPPPLVYSAALWTDRATGVAHFESKREIRSHLAASGLPACVLEPGSFLENLLYPRTVKAVGSGRLVIPLACEVPQPVVAIADIGRFAAWCLENPGKVAGNSYPLYAEVITHHRIAELMSDHLGREIRCKPLPRWIRRLALGRDLSGMFFWFESAGYADHQLPPVEQFVTVLGQPLTTMRWLAETEYGQ